MTNQTDLEFDKKLDEILANQKAYKREYDNFTVEEHFILYPELKETKQAVKQLIIELLEGLPRRKVIDPAQGRAITAIYLNDINQAINQLKGEKK